MKYEYDHADADGYHRGIMLGGQPNVKRIYKLISTDTKRKLARLESIDVWGQLHTEIFPLHTIEKLTTPINR